MSDAGVRVHGAATAEEVAAVLAALQLRAGRVVVTDDRFGRWRRQRQELVRDNR
jgi:hypothetical protein